MIKYYMPLQSFYVSLQVLVRLYQAFSQLRISAKNDPWKKKKSAAKWQNLFVSLPVFLGCIGRGSFLVTGVTGCVEASWKLK